MQKKRVILMYISETSGHHSATIAIEKAIKLLSPHSETLNINAFNYTNPISERIVNRIYMGIIKRTPHLWDYLYDNPTIVKKVTKIKEMIHKFNSPKFNNLFKKFKPDVVVCTQAFPAGMVADYKKTYNSAMPLVAVLTDYIPHAYWVYENIDYYICPSPEVTQRLITKGVPLAKTKDLGIPFDPAFNTPVDKESILKKLKLSNGVLTLLIMGGGQGFGPIKTIVKSLEKVPGNIQEIIVSGTNKKLYKSLKKKAKKSKHKMLVFGYSNAINEFMSIADAIITKPGGITTSEALAKKLPLIIVKPIPGQEASNTQYLIERKAAIKVTKPRAINLVIQDLLENPEKLHNLQEAARRISKPNASLDIAKFILGL